jgi:4-azaleucine resistance transporter AzlC
MDAASGMTPSYVTSSRFAELAMGARDTIPMLVGAAPFGVIFGALVASSSLSPLHGQLMSLTVFAGSSQFVAVGLISAHAGLAVIWTTTFVINIRHVLYSATLAPCVAHWPARWRWLLAGLLTDEVFAIANARYSRHPAGTLGPHYFFGSGLAMYLNWQLWTLVGLRFGAAWPRLQTLGLDFAVIATFIAIVVPQLAAPRYIAAAVAAGTLAFFCRDWPYQLGLMAAVLVGVAVGTTWCRLIERRNKAAIEATR